MSLKELLQGKSAIRGRSTAFIVTVAVHVVFFLVAGVYVALEVFKDEEPRFEGEQLSRPKMQLKKLKVPIKVQKIKQPKMQQMAAPTQVTKMNVDMPTMGGVGGGMGSFGGGGLGSLGFGLKFDLFGGDTGELEGTFYDLKQTADGVPIPSMNVKRGKGLIDDPRNKVVFDVLSDFLRSWNSRELNKFYQAEQKKYAISFIMPFVNANTAPAAFGVQDEVDPAYWAIHYKGEITAPETGMYRFWAEADDALVVSVNNDIVIDATHPAWIERFGRTLTGWESKAPESKQFPEGHTVMVVGDWFRLSRGRSVPVEMLLSEIPGGNFSCYLYIEQKDKEYRMITVNPGSYAKGKNYQGGTRPVLPVFKMAQIPSGLIPKMQIGPNQATLDGPIFGSGK
jgi:hypothetical protein